MNAYWMAEYGKVFIGYLFLMFLWPTVVFWDCLKGKTKIWHFSFCVTVQILLVNTVVLTLGLFRILDGRLTAGLFYGLFFPALLKRGKKPKDYRKMLNKLWSGIRPRMGEYAVLFVVAAFGMAYVSHGALQMHSYGQNDVFIHHGWVNSLMEGEIFPNGVYPQAMHCFIYSLHVLTGIRIYSIMLFLPCVHVAVFLLSAYCLLREVFCWRYSPVFALGLYLTLDFIIYHSMSRLQAALPMEFGLHTQFLCGLYLLRYFKSAEHTGGKKGTLHNCRNENLLLFMTALGASVATHYYMTVMAFLLCASFALFHIRRWIRPGVLFPLLFSAVCGCLAAFGPMAGGLALGIPFEGSVDWAVRVMGMPDEENGIGETEESGSSLELSEGDREVLEKLPPLGRKIMKGIIKTEYLVKTVRQKGYKAMYWDEEGGKRGSRIWGVTLAVTVLCLMGSRSGSRRMREISSRYFPVILISFLSMLIFAACDDPKSGLPVLIADHRYGSTGHMMTLAVMVMPADLLFFAAARFFRDQILQVASWGTVAGIYLSANLSGSFHEYLFWVMFRYPAAVQVTESVMREFPRGSYTVVSPREEPYQLGSYGKHEEISGFIRNCEKGTYFLTTEYVFLYVEKKPLVYFQNYYLEGPSWLAGSRGAALKAEEISEEAAKEPFQERDAIWDFYMDNRVILESKAYEWCQYFLRKHPTRMKIYYEDEEFVCYYFRQDPVKPYDLSFGGER